MPPEYKTPHWSCLVEFGMIGHYDTDSFDTHVAETDSCFHVPISTLLHYVITIQQTGCDIVMLVQCCCVCY